MLWSRRKPVTPTQLALGNDVWNALTRSTALLSFRCGVPGCDQGHACRICASAQLHQGSTAPRAHNSAASAAAYGTLPADSDNHRIWSRGSQRRVRLACTATVPAIGWRSAHPARRRGLAVGRGQAGRHFSRILKAKCRVCCSVSINSPRRLMRVRGRARWPPQPPCPRASLRDPAGKSALYAAMACAPTPSHSLILHVAIALAELPALSIAVAWMVRLLSSSSFDRSGRS